MKLVIASTVLLTLAIAVPANAACKGRTAQRTGPNGTITVCLDGSYTTCVRDARDRLGWGQAGVERCNKLRAEGRVK